MIKPKDSSVNARRQGPHRGTLHDHSPHHVLTLVHHTPFPVTVPLRFKVKKIPVRYCFFLQLEGDQRHEGNAGNRWPLEGNRRRLGGNQRRLEVINGGWRFAVGGGF